MKKIIGSIAALLIASAVFAQDFDDSMSFDSSYEEEEENPLSISGSVGTDFRAYINTDKGYRKSTKSFGEKYFGLSDKEIFLDDSISQEAKSKLLKRTTDQSFADSIVENTILDKDAYANLSFDYSGKNTEMSASLVFDAGTIKDNPEDIVDELIVRGYFGNWVVEAGKMKIVWGKGDKLHVLDNFNANNYSDFIFPDYIDRRLSEIMFRVAYNVPNASNIRIEGVFTPSMTADRFATSGPLVPYTMTKLTNGVKTMVMNNLTSSLNAVASTQEQIALAEAAAPGSGAIYRSALLLNQMEFLESLTAANELNSNPDSLYPDTDSLKYAQAGARITGTLSSFDWGFSYYYGHLKQPSVNQKKYADTIAFATPAITSAVVDGLMADGPAGNIPLTKEGIEEYKTAVAQKYLLQNGTYLDIPEINYDKVQIFGFEFAKVLWKFNTRGEIAYNLTEDHTGSNPWIKNNSISWLGGFDIDLPIHNLNVNFQETGSVTLKRNKITNNKKYIFNEATNDFLKVDYSTYDVDYKSNHKYYSNKLVLNVSDTFLYEKLKTECTTIYVFPTDEWCVQPKITYNVIDGMNFVLSGGYIYSNNENGEFYNFTAGNKKHHNMAFAQLSVTYTF